MTEPTAHAPAPAATALALAARGLPASAARRAHRAGRPGRLVPVGSPVTIRSGALGGTISGLVISMTLTYVTLHTEHGTMLLPNTAVLASAIGPEAEWQG